MKGPNEILTSSFFQIISIYAILVLVVCLKFLSKYSIHLEILALILALSACFTLNMKRNIINKNIHIIILILSSITLVFSRVFSYFKNSIPLGYDPGIYFYSIKTPSYQLDSWVFNAQEPGFIYLTHFLNIFLPANWIMVPLYIIFSLLLGVAVYFCVKEYFGKDAAVFSLFIYSISIIQFKAFAYFYYKNIIGMALMLLAFYYLKKENKWGLVITGGLLGAFHRPTFYLFGLSYFVYALSAPYQNKKYDVLKLRKNVAIGLYILAIFFLTHAGKFSGAIFSLIDPVLSSFVEPGQASGTFINFFTYQFSVLPYLALGLLGFFYTIRSKNFNILVIWGIINAIIVIFQLFFFNRFIIQLDLALIIFAGLGAVLIISERKVLGSIIVGLLLLSGSILAIKETINAEPLISEQELESIEKLSTTEQDAFVMATSSTYSPWLVGYSERKTIAPGLFDYNQHNQAEWNRFWTTNNLTEVRTFMDVYEKPLYIYIGPQQKNNLAQFEECFETFYSQDKNYIYKYVC